ncbi:hypothetical protein [Aureimonas altamirensis]|uniref:hypothetical protein n=1 Tax=Aureimonas altamirensis TaxID=370622 RepID=UPI003018E775
MTVPAYGMPLLNVIAGTESPAYNVINGGERFASYGDHPRRVGRGGSSTAAGRYQFVKGTWDRVARNIGAKDFSPSNQDAGAWWLAQADYRSRTGRDLAVDLQSGDAATLAQVKNGLGATWEGLHKLPTNEFVRRMGASPASLPADSSHAASIQDSALGQGSVSGQGGPAGPGVPPSLLAPSQHGPDLPSLLALSDSGPGNSPNGYQGMSLLSGLGEAPTPAPEIVAEPIDANTPNMALMEMIMPRRRSRNKSTTVLT